MAQHFTQSKAARNLTITSLAALSEYEANRLLLQIRFAENGGEPACPACGRTDISVRTDRRFFCRKCRKAFSVTSGTLLHGKRVSSKALLIMFAAFIREKKGLPSVALANQMGCSPMTAWVWLHKMREAMQSDADGVVLSGVCEADGCYFDAWVREHVYRHMRTDGRQNRNKKVVCAVRERNGRVLVEINPDEKSFEPYIRSKVAPGTELHTDTATTFVKLGDTYALRMINHGKQFWSRRASTNSVESFFRRLRAAEDVYIKISGKYLDLYAWEAAFRETYCRTSDAEKFVRLISLCLRHPVSRRFVGYFQRRRGS